MKPIFFLLTVLSSFFAQAANNPSEVAPAAIKSFQRTFAAASDVSWSVSEELNRVTFQVAGQYASAYYTNDGEMVVITRNISPLQLPVMLLTAIKKDYQDQWISNLIEVSDEAGTRYYVTLEDANQRITLKSDENTRWNRYQKTEK